MPNIRTYDAPLDRLSPDNRGNSAFETAARRIGPLYNQAAEDVRSAAAAKARALKDSEWPFSIADLEAALDDVRVRRAGTSGSSGEGGGGGSGTANFKLAGDINSFFKGGGGGSTGHFPAPAKPSKGGGPATSSDRAGAEIAGSAAGLTRLTRNLFGESGSAPGGLVKVGPGMYAPDTSLPGFHGSKTDLSYPDDLVIPGWTGKRGDLGVAGEDTGLKYPLPNGYEPSPISRATASAEADDYARRGVNTEELPGSVPAGADTGVSPDIPDAPNSGHWWDSYIPSFPWSNSSDTGSQTVTAAIPPRSEGGDYGGGGEDY